LKEDRFRKFTAEQAHWAVEHRDNLIKASAALVIVLGVLVGAIFTSTIAMNWPAGN